MFRQDNIYIHMILMDMCINVYIYICVYMIQFIQYNIYIYTYLNKSMHLYLTLSSKCPTSCNATHQQWIREYTSATRTRWHLHDEVHQTSWLACLIPPSILQASVKGHRMHGNLNANSAEFRKIWGMWKQACIYLHRYIYIYNPPRNYPERGGPLIL